MFFYGGGQSLPNPVLAPNNRAKTSMCDQLQRLSTTARKRPHNQAKLTAKEVNFGVGNLDKMNLTEGPRRLESRVSTKAQALKSLHFLSAAGSRAFNQDGKGTLKKMNLIDLISAVTKGRDQRNLRNHSQAGNQDNFDGWRKPIHKGLGAQLRCFSTPVGSRAYIHNQGTLTAPYTTTANSRGF